MRAVSYVDSLDVDYVNGLRACDTLEQLRAFAESWDDLAHDGKVVVDSLDQESFEQFRDGLKNHKRWRSKDRIKTWTLRFGAIVLPEVILHVGMIASHFHAPWGTAFNRCVEHGNVKRAGDHFVWAEVGS
jgi:hypothetical protein